QVRFHLEAYPQAAPHDGLIIYEQHTNHDALVCQSLRTSDCPRSARAMCYNTKQDRSWALGDIAQRSAVLSRSQALLLASASIGCGNPVTHLANEGVLLILW